MHILGLCFENKSMGYMLANVDPRSQNDNGAKFGSSITLQVYKQLLTLGAHAQQGYGTQFVCLYCLSVCLSATALAAADSFM